MKLAVTSQGPDLDSLIYVRFDMAKYFVVVDTDSGEFTTHDNAENCGGFQDAAHQAANGLIGRSTGKQLPRPDEFSQAAMLPEVTASDREKKAARGIRATTLV